MAEFKVQLRLPNQIQQGDIIEVKLKIQHPSTTGLTLVEDAPNPFQRFRRAEPAQFLREVQVFYGDEQISLFEMNSAASDDPLMAFKLRADKQAPLRVVVTNHLRETQEATAPVQFS